MNRFVKIDVKESAGVAVCPTWLCLRQLALFWFGTQTGAVPKNFGCVGTTVPLRWNKNFTAVKMLYHCGGISVQLWFV